MSMSEVKVSKNDLLVWYNCLKSVHWGRCRWEARVNGFGHRQVVVGPTLCLCCRKMFVGQQEWSLCTVQHAQLQPTSTNSPDSLGKRAHIVEPARRGGRGRRKCKSLTSSSQFFGKYWLLLRFHHNSSTQAAGDLKKTSPCCSFLQALLWGF